MFAKNGRSHETASSNSRSRRAGTGNNHGGPGGGGGSVPMYPVSHGTRNGGTMNDRKSSDATSSQEHIIEPYGPVNEIEGGAGVGVGRGSDMHGRSTPGPTAGINKTVGFEISETRVG